MVGGKVVEVNGDYDHVEVIVEDENEKLAIKVQVTDDARWIDEGDSLWWQGRNAYWTPKSSIDHREDVKIPRIGYSYKPEVIKIEE
jgi:hypothetical protein